MLKILEKLLGAGKISEEVAKEIDTDLSGELKKLRDESAKWRTKYNELNSTYEEVVSSKSKLEEQVKNIDEKIKKAKDEGKKELVTELEKEKQEKSELMQKLNELENTTKTLKIENALSKVLAIYEVLDSEIVSDVLKSKLQVVDNEIKFDDGLPLEDGVKKFFESKPHLLKPKGNEGSGAGSSGSGYDENTLTAKLLSKMKG
jgi:chromosome segregation ATPase